MSASSYNTNADNNKYKNYNNVNNSFIKKNYNKIKKEQEKILNHLNQLIHIDDDDNKNYIIEASPGVGKTNILFQHLSNFKNILIICNKWNIQSWYNKIYKKYNKYLNINTHKHKNEYYKIILIDEDYLNNESKNNIDKDVNTSVNTDTDTDKDKDKDKDVNKDKNKVKDKDKDVNTDKKYIYLILDSAIPLLLEHFLNFHNSYYNTLSVNIKSNIENSNYDGDETNIINFYNYKNIYNLITNTNFNYIKFLYNKFDIVICDELNKINFIPCYKICYLLCESFNDSIVKTKKNDCFYNKFFKKFVIFNKYNILKNIVALNDKFRNQHIINFKSDDFDILKLQEYLIQNQNKKIIIIVKDINIIKDALFSYTNRSLIINNESDYKLIEFVKNLYYENVCSSSNNKYTEYIYYEKNYNIDKKYQYNYYNNYIDDHNFDYDHTGYYEYRKCKCYCNKILKFNLLVMCNINNINSISLSNTNTIIMIGNHQNLNQYVNRCVRITTNNNQLDVIKYKFNI